MAKQIFTVGSGEQERLDKFLSERAAGYPRSVLQALIKQGAVTVNGKVRKPAWPLQEGDSVEATWPAKKASMDIRDLIVYEDKDLFVISKPAGMLVHPQSSAWETNPRAAYASEETLVSLILARPPEGFSKTTPRAGLIHRLDKDTSGVMLIAKNRKAQSAVAEMFAAREIYKEYEAIIIGAPEAKEGVIDVPIGRVAGGKIKAGEMGKEAKTEYEILESVNGFSLARLRPVTGRTNQLRVHMNWLGHPLLGDWLYQSKEAKKNPALAGLLETPRLMLHAKRVSFISPFTGKKVSFSVPPPKDFKDTWKQIKNLR